MKNKSIKIVKRPRLKNPILIAAWPGMGNVAVRAVEFMIEQLKPRLLAEVSSEGFFYSHEAWIINSQISLPRLPKGRFFYWSNPASRNDLIIFLCEAQPAVEKGYEYAEFVLELAEEFKIKRIFTFASMPVPIDHTQPSRVWATVTDKKLLKSLSSLDVKPMHVGQISGLNGLLLSVAKERRLEGFCFLAEIPLYAIQIENPKAAKAVLTVFSRIAGIKFDFSSLEERSKIVEDEIEKLVNYFKSGTIPGPISDEEIENIKQTLASVTKLPESAKTKIEELFGLAEKDITKAGELKRELDKWHIYKDYEDRFLDLFKSDRKDRN
ncbi:MAG: PAC2 family protein [Candidatus Omnitrophica bacterium]|nr:PAC2 family protein [Candidatus Omnitrophota bacterium]MBU1925544.1 PAC2 family protein [Candidatus Omnitrophota bacterium]